MALSACGPRDEATGRARGGLSPHDGVFSTPHDGHDGVPYSIKFCMHSILAALSCAPEYMGCPLRRALR